MSDIETRNPPDSEVNSISNLYDSGDFLGAENLCRNLLKTYPDSEVLSNILGVVFQAQGKSKEALEAYENAVRKASDYPVGYNNLGFLLNSLGRPEEAIENFKKVAELDPEDGLSLIHI